MNGKNYVFLLTAVFLSAAFFQTMQVFGQGFCTPAPVGLVSWYPADGNTLDARSRNNGALGGTFGHAPTYAAGKVGQTFQLDGQSTVGIPDSPSLHITQTLTLEAWINPAAGQTGLTSIIFKGNPNSLSAQPYSLFLDAGDSNNYKLNFRIGNETTATALDSATSLPPNTYTFVAATYDGATMRIYINGVLDASVTNNFGTLNNTDTNSLVIGDASGNFTGAVDEFSIYNRVLSAAEVQAIYNSQGNGKCKPTATAAPAGQVLWLAGDGDGRDLSGSGNNGILQNGANFAVGKVGQSFNFNASAGNAGNNVKVNASTSLNVGTGGGLTIETWMRPTNITRAQVFAEWNNGGSIGINCAINAVVGGNANGDIIINFVDTNGSNHIVQTAENLLTANVYQHIAASYDKTTGIGNIYLNGAVVASQNLGVFTPLTTYDLYFGTRVTTGGIFNFDGQLDEPSLYNRALSNDEIASIYRADLAGKLKQTTTAANTATVGSATVTFSTAANRTVQQIPLDPSLFTALPMGMNTGLTYDIAASVGDSNPTVCFNLPSFNAAQFSGLRIYHLEGGVWQNRTGSSNSATSTLCTAGLTSLSPFAIGTVGTTAADASISGRVVTAQGRGIPQARVSLTGSDGVPRSVMTNSFGVFTIAGIESGSTYIVNVSAKGYSFAPQVISLTESVSRLTFVGQR